MPAPEPASLTITKVATAAEGATVPEDWSAGFESDPLGAFTLTSTDPSLESTDLDAGTYTVTESELSRYRAGQHRLRRRRRHRRPRQADGVGRSAAGEVASCTFTNEYQATEVLPAEEEAHAHPDGPDAAVMDSTVTRTLPRTGDESGKMATVGLGLLMFGIVLTMGSRRRLRTLS